MVCESFQRHGGRRLGLRAALAAVACAVAAHCLAQEPATIERVKASIVAVGTFERLRSPQFNFLGTGFAVGDGSLIATNEHVVPKVLAVEQSEMLAIALRSADTGLRVLQAERVAADTSADLALLKVASARLPPLVLGDSAAVREGELYLFTGFPIGSVLGLYPVTHRAMVASITPIVIPAAHADQLDARSVRALKRNPFAVFQLDGTAYPGNSGSPVYHPASGRVIGIVNSVFVKGTKESALTAPSGITYAIPAQRLKDLLDQARQ